MVWRKTNPLASQFGAIAEIVRDAGNRKAWELGELPGVREQPPFGLTVAG